MPAALDRSHPSRSALASIRWRRRLAGCAAIVALILATQSALAAECTKEEDKPSLPASEEPAINIDKHKKQLKAYHNAVPANAATTAYLADIKRVIDNAQRYVLEQAATVEKPAVVLDIDETSLSNWDNIEINDFGFIKKGNCSLQAQHACGFDAWIDLEKATLIGPTLEFYNAIRAKRIAVFFVTGRRHAQRSSTIRNLKRAGFKDWSGLMTRPDDDHADSIVPFKSGQRAMIESKDKAWGYTIIANIGDQQSDLEGGHSRCAFKLPNPFYFIK